MSILITGPNGLISNPAEVNSDISIAENTKNIFAFTANLSVTWSVSAWPGNEGEEDFFTIDTASGLLSFKTAPDYENPLDNKKQNSYDVLVVATHSNGTSSYQAVDVTVTNVINEKTYIINPSKTSINEGLTLTTSISTTNVAEDTTLYYSLSGAGINNADFSDGELIGSGTVDESGDYSFSHTLANDLSTEGSETLNIKLFSDLARTTQVGSTASITIVDTSNSTITGTESNEILIGTHDDNEINALAGSDNITGGQGNDTINGGVGSDTSVYSGKFSDYSLTREVNSLIIADQRTGTNDGTDTLKNIEYIQFTDQTVEESKVDVVKTYSGEFSDYKFYNKGDGVYQIKTDSGYDDITGLPLLTFTGEATTSSFRDISAIVDIKGTFDQVTGLNTDSGRMFRLYNASFKRLPDADGLEYWINQFSSGANSIRVVASSFLGSSEFAERYGSNVTDEKFVNTLYQNVLGRAADSLGLSYWLRQLNSGAETRYEVLLGFAESAENKGLFTEMTGIG